MAGGGGAAAKKGGGGGQRRKPISDGEDEDRGAERPLTQAALDREESDEEAQSPRFGETKCIHTRGLCLISFPLQDLLNVLVVVVEKS